MINGIYLKLGSLLANYDVKPLSKFGGNRKNRTNSTSHSLRYPGGYRFVRPVTKGLRRQQIFGLSTAAVSTQVVYLAQRGLDSNHSIAWI